MAAAANADAYAAADPPWTGLRGAIESLFAPPPRPRRPARKSARLHPGRQQPMRLNPVPLPHPRPADAAPAAAAPVAHAPKRAAQIAGTEPAPQPQPAPPAKQTPPPVAAEAPAAGPSAPSECQLRLTPDLAVAHALPPITGPGQCGAEDVVRLDAVMLKDGRRVALAPAATLRCGMAEAVVQWVRDAVAPALADLGGTPRTLVVAASYDCRARNRVIGARLSEHGHANALDLRGLTLADGSTVDFTERSVAKAFRERIRQSACARFMTVLGPGSDGYHERHVHLDLVERRGGHRMCQWEVSPVPEVASVPMPPERPRAAAPDKRSAQ